MRRKMDAFPYTPYFTGPTVRFDQSTKNCSIATLIWVRCRMFYSSKINNIGYTLLKQTPFKTPKNLEEKVCRGKSTN